MGVKHYTDVFKIGHQMFKAAIQQTSYWKDGRIIVEKVELKREMIRNQ